MTWGECRDFASQTQEKFVFVGLAVFEMPLWSGSVPQIHNDFEMQSHGGGPSPCLVRCPLLPTQRSQMPLLSLMFD